jgi:hypothetical protein
MIDFKTYLKLHHEDLADRIDSNADATDGQLELNLDTDAEPPKQPFLLLLPTEIKGYNVRTKTWGKTFAFHNYIVL